MVKTTLSYHNPKYLRVPELCLLCMPFHLKLAGTSCTDDAIVKVPSFQKVTVFSTI